MSQLILCYMNSSQYVSVLQDSDPSTVTAAEPLLAESDPAVSNSEENFVTEMSVGLSTEVTFKH